MPRLPLSDHIRITSILKQPIRKDYGKMRDPIMINTVRDIYDDKVTSLMPYDIVPEYDIEDDKDFMRYLTDIKFKVRMSFEYRELMAFLKDHMDMNSCSVLCNVNGAMYEKVKIHMHHHPFTLEDIVRIVVSKRLTRGETYDVFDVAEEVMYLHYAMLVGLIPLSATVHELVHSNYIFIPMNKVFGYINTFIELYKEYIDKSSDLRDVLERNIEYSDTYESNPDLWDHTKVLERRYVYYGENEETDYTVPISIMDKRINEIREALYDDTNTSSNGDTVMKDIIRVHDSTENI
jgi:hypothetical protein